MGNAAGLELSMAVHQYRLVPQMLTILTVQRRITQMALKFTLHGGLPLNVFRYSYTHAHKRARMRITRSC